MDTSDARTVDRLLIAGMAVFFMGSCQSYTECPSVDPALLAQFPERLSETGLDAAAVFPYEPEFALWSDGADKRRFAFIPSTIDASNMDVWDFPVGSKFWKEFSRNGVKLETRLLARLSDRDWFAASYLWNEEQSEALLTPEGKSNVLGTTHDVPSAAQCAGCHGNSERRVLGFSAIQLSSQMQALVQQGTLKNAEAPFPTVPGDTDTRAALGYLHANCGHCHDERRAPTPATARCYDPRSRVAFALHVDELETPERTATYRTARNSGLLQRMDSRGGLLPSMPPLATEEIDESGVAVVRRWINQLH
jgi:hypothetical protein